MRALTSNQTTNSTISAQFLGAFIEDINFIGDNIHHKNPSNQFAVQKFGPFSHGRAVPATLRIKTRCPNELPPLSVLKLVKNAPKTRSNRRKIALDPSSQPSSPANRKIVDYFSFRSPFAACELIKA